MAIEFREVRRGQIDDALAFAAGCGAAIDRQDFRHDLSLLALDGSKATLGSALAYVADDRLHLRVDVAEGVAPGLARLLADRALRKAESQGRATAHLDVADAQLAAQLFAGADLLAKLQATVRPRPPRTSYRPPLEPAPGSDQAADGVAA
jgi:hypothetical protein